jgi:hypothetical protein
VAIAHVFEKPPADADGRRAALAQAMARWGGAHSAPVLTRADELRGNADPRGGSGADPGADPGVIAVPGALAELVPGGVRRGEAVALRGGPGSGPNASNAMDYLTLSLLAEALRAGLWCAAVGTPELGGAALAGLLGGPAVREGALQRLLVVAEPGERWAEAAAVLADGVDLLLVSPPGTVSAQVARRLDARLRQGVADSARHRAALLVLGAWPSARTVLRVRRLGWSGLGEGTGHLAGGRAEITAEDRARRVRSVRVWLPGEDGAVLPLAGDGRQAGGERGSGARRLTAVA